AMNGPAVPSANSCSTRLGSSRPPCSSLRAPRGLIADHRQDSASAGQLAYGRGPCRSMWSRFFHAKALPVTNRNLKRLASCHSFGGGGILNVWHHDLLPPNGYAALSLRIESSKYFLRCR